MRAHPLAIVGMNERRPFGAFHLAIARQQAEHLEELRRAVRHLILEIPLEGGHTAGALRQAQHLLAVTKRACGVRLAAF